MLSKIFIERPILSTVISLVILLAGLVSIKALPTEQYPNIVPTEIQVSAVYPGATAEVLADTVAAPLEQEINGVKDYTQIEGLYELYNEDIDYTIIKLTV